MFSFCFSSFLIIYLFLIVVVYCCGLSPRLPPKQKYKNSILMLVSIDDFHIRSSEVGKGMNEKLWEGININST
ncbi:unnamed protein product [Meloidogyne enterolobii]|uniref:Uncharacterized protein n=1 Tax=Meloidogyne enterolobii TaxID=390850 RepID=A0ACB1APW1_MELEN